jgi:hypothetical protein
MLSCLLAASCATTVNRADFDAAIARHDTETINWVWYMGTKDGYHYLRHRHTIGAHTYRIAVAELPIADPFPLTRDETKWRPLTRHWEPWGTAGGLTGPSPTPSP